MRSPTSVLFVITLPLWLHACSLVWGDGHSPTVSTSKPEIGTDVSPGSNRIGLASEDTTESSAANPDLGAALDLAFLRRASPRAKAAILEGFSRSDLPLASAGIDANADRLLHFLAQTAVETFGWRTLTENLNYSAERLRKVFPSRVTEVEAEALHRRPRAIANHVYGTRLGNRPGTDDGWNFRGSGYLQLTGRENFTRAGDRLGIALEESPDQVREPKLGLDSAIAYWTGRGVNTVADTGTHEQVRRAINGGTNGLAEAKIWHAQISKAYHAGRPQPESAGRRVDPLESAVAGALWALGFLIGPQFESTFEDGRYQDALRRFQVSRNLEPTGVFDEPTLYAITDPLGRYSES